MFVMHSAVRHSVYGEEMCARLYAGAGRMHSCDIRRSDDRLTGQALRKPRNWSDYPEVAAESDI